MKKKKLNQKLGRNSNCLWSYSCGGEESVVGTIVEQLGF